MSKKKKASKPTEMRSQPRWYLVLAITLITTAGVMFVWLGEQRPEQAADRPAKPPRITASVAPVATIDSGPTPEQERFMRERFLADWERIRKAYPIADIRNRFDRLAQRVLNKDIRLHVSALYLNRTETDVIALADRQGDLKVLQFFAPALLDLYHQITDVDLRDDILIGVVLHEEYHIDHHVFAHTQDQLTHALVAMEEGETWWWCVETLYIPMIEQRRLRHLPPTDSVSSALRAYGDARGDRNSLPWLTFCQAASSAYKRRSQ